MNIIRKRVDFKNMKKIIIADNMHPSILTMLEESGFAHEYQPGITRAELLEKIGDFEGIIIRSKTVLDEEFLQKAGKLEFIARAGAGLDLIDIEAVEKRNIVLINAPEGNRDALGEHCIGMLLCLFNKINWADTEVRNGIWKREANRGVELMGKTVGLIGYGNMGRAFATRLSSFGVKVLAYDKYLDNYSDQFAKEATLAQIYQEADILSLHIPLTDESKEWLDIDFFQRFQKDIFLINSARGEIVKLKDLWEAMQTGKVLGACLDVLENEKLDKLSEEQKSLYAELFRQKNILFTPHVAGWTHESYVKINEVLVKKILNHYNVISQKY